MQTSEREHVIALFVARGVSREAAEGLTAHMAAPAVPPETPMSRIAAMCATADFGDTCAALGIHDPAARLAFAAEIEADAQGAIPRDQRTGQPKWVRP